MLDSWPRNKLVAVASLLAAMTPDSKVSMERIKREDLFPDHTGMADFIRQHFGLWDGNTALIESCQRDSSDDLAMSIIETTWSVAGFRRILGVHLLEAVVKGRRRLG